MRGEAFESMFRRAFYDGVLPDGSIYEAGGETARRWRACQANELCHAALGALFNGLMWLQDGK